MDLSIIILAAGIGKRMKSSIPKVLHKLCGKPLISYVIEKARTLEPKEIFLVLAQNKEMVLEIIPRDIKIIDQREPKGTGHAIKVVYEREREIRGDVLILSGDVPLIEEETLKNFYEKHKKNKSDLSFLTAILDDPSHYGRVIRKNGKVERIVEAKDCNERELKIKEINSGIYILNWGKVTPFLKDLKNENSQREYYLTALVELAVKGKLKVFGFPLSSFMEIKGINTRKELSEMGLYLYKKKTLELMEKGVTILDPSNTYISPNVEIERDTIIYPGSYIENSKIGEGCILQSNVFIKDSEILSGTIVYPFTVIENSKIGKNCKIGPSAHLRSGTILKDEVRLGNFVETKNSTLGKGTKAAHLSYLGDAIIGDNVNIGCGTITCNYDGIKKHQTIIEDGAFIGSDCQLVAPVKVGKNAYTASGTTITEDVPESSLAIARVPQRNVLNWVKKRRKK